MKPWVTFEWDLSTFSAEPLKLPTRLKLEAGKAEEAKAIEAVMHRALMTEQRWSVELPRRQELVHKVIFEDLLKGDAFSLVIRDGARIIGATLTTDKPETYPHLVAGVCILHEYRCRGLGTALLQAALSQLKEKGVSSARVHTLLSMTSERYLYTKFNSKRTVLDPGVIPTV